MKRLALALALALLLLPHTQAYANPSPFAAVLTLTDYYAEQSSLSKSVTPIAQGEPLPSCYIGGTSSAWYEVTTNIKGFMQSFVDGGFPGDLRTIALYRGTPFTGLTELGCSSDQPTIMALTANMREGDAVYMQVIADGPFAFRATLYPTSAIDNFADAELLTLGYTSNATWDTTGGTTEPGEPLPCGGTRTAWVKYVADQSGPVTFMNLAGHNEVLAVYSGSSLSNLQLLGCAASHRYQESSTFNVFDETRLRVSLENNATYYVQIATSGSGSGVVLMVSHDDVVTNDTPASAVPLAQNHSVVGTTVGAFTNQLDFMCPYQFGSVWYLVTPASSGSLEVSVDSKRTEGFWNFAPTVAIHRADTGATLACAENSTFNVTQVVPVEAGASYLVAVGAVNRPGDYRLHWAVK
jgi:hypothetical protein